MSGFGDDELEQEPGGEFPSGLTPMHIAVGSARKLDDAYSLRAKAPRGPEGDPEHEVFGVVTDEQGEEVELRPGFIPEPVDEDGTHFRVGWSVRIADHPELKRIFVVGAVIASTVALGGIAIHQRRKKSG